MAGRGHSSRKAHQVIVRAATEDPCSLRARHQDYFQLLQKARQANSKVIAIKELVARKALALH